jgi:hypothetical protein
MIEKSNSATIEIVDASIVHIGSMMFEQENSEWSLLPTQTSTLSIVLVLDKGFSTPQKTPCTSPTASI